MQAQSLAVGYARVSIEGEDINNQVHAIEDYAKTNNLTLVGVFRDVGVSGAKPALEREGFKRMLNALESMTVLFDLLGFCCVYVFSVCWWGCFLDVFFFYALLYL